jgi:hypothetical protein
MAQRSRSQIERGLSVREGIDEAGALLDLAQNGLACLALVCKVAI